MSETWSNILCCARLVAAMLAVRCRVRGTHDTLQKVQRCGAFNGLQLPVVETFDTQSSEQHSADAHKFLLVLLLVAWMRGSTKSPQGVEGFLICMATV